MYQLQIYTINKNQKLTTINQNEMKIRIVICIILLMLNKSNYYYR